MKLIYQWMFYFFQRQTRTNHQMVQRKPRINGSGRLWDFLQGWSSQPDYTRSVRGGCWEIHLHCEKCSRKCQQLGRAGHQRWGSLSGSLKGVNWTRTSDLMVMHNERGEKGQGHEPRVSVWKGQIGMVIRSRSHCHDHVKGSNWQGHPISGLLFFNLWGQKKVFKVKVCLTL